MTQDTEVEAQGVARITNHESRVTSHEAQVTRRRALALLVVSAVLPGALAGCGFRPSGAPPLPFQTLYISAPSYSSFAAELKRYIASGGHTVLTERPEEAQAVLEIQSEQQETHILSLTAAGRVAEHQLRYRIGYRLHDLANKDWIPPSEILLRRDLTYDDQAVLAKENEQALLFQAMREDAVRQIMRRLSLARAPEPAA
jgi:LPS-assembly lipoprotein